MQRNLNGYSCRARSKCTSEYEAAGLVDLGGLERKPIVSHCDAIHGIQSSCNFSTRMADLPSRRCSQYRTRTSAFASQWVLATAGQLHANPPGYMLGDIILSMGRHIFFRRESKVGIRHTTQRYGSLTRKFLWLHRVTGQASLYCQLVERGRSLLRLLPEARHSRRSTMRGNPYKDPT